MQNENEGLHLEDATVSAEKITHQNKNEYHFMLDKVDDIILSRLYGEKAGEFKDRWIAEYYVEMEYVFDEMIDKYPDNLFEKFLLDRENLATEMQSRVEELHKEMHHEVEH